MEYDEIDRIFGTLEFKSVSIKIKTENKVYRGSLDKKTGEEQILCRNNGFQVIPINWERQNTMLLKCLKNYTEGNYFLG